MHPFRYLGPSLNINVTVVSVQIKMKISFYYINTSEIPSELSSHDKITCYLHT